VQRHLVRRLEDLARDQGAFLSSSRVRLWSLSQKGEAARDGGVGIRPEEDEYRRVGLLAGLFDESETGRLRLAAWMPEPGRSGEALPSPAAVEGRGAGLGRHSGEEQQQAGGDEIALLCHDLKTPLTVVRGHAQLLCRALQEGRVEQAGKSAQSILAATRRLQEMVADLVEEDRSRDGGRSICLETLDLRLLVDGLVGEIAAEAEASRVCFETAEEPPLVHADSKALERILMNLIANALKYSTPGSKVTVRLEKEGNETLISIVDEGEGIPEEQLPHLFERHYRVARSGKPAGQGLGLFIARRLVEAQGGRLWVESQPGCGSTFHFTLAAVQDPFVFTK
jgi:signal transduction histidine kinase